MELSNLDWDGLIVRLQRTPLAELAAELEASLPDLEAGLIARGTSSAVANQPWWPEVLRRLDAGQGIRRVARSFDTTPRRIRRGLASAGLRVGGVDIRRSGVPELSEFQHRLGREPDADISFEAGVTLEEVRAERSRLNIPPFQPRRPQRRRSRTPSSRPEVIRRGAPVRQPDSHAAPPSAANVLPLHPGVPLPEEATPAPRRRVGRRRIVRPTNPVIEEFEAPEPAPEPRRPRRRRASPHGEVRMVDADQIDVEALRASLERPRMGLPPRPEPRPQRAPAPQRPPPAAASPRTAWHASVDGTPLPLVLLAADLPAAIAVLARNRPAIDLCNVSIWRAGALLERRGQ